MDINALEIKKKDLDDFQTRAEQWIKNVKYRPAKQPGDDNDYDDDVFIRSSFGEGSGGDSISLYTFAQKLSQNQLLLSNETHFLVSEILSAIKIGLYMFEQYNTASGLEHLQKQKNIGELSENHRTEFYDKLRTGSVITGFSMANYLHYSLAQYKPQEVSAILLKFHGIPEVNTTSENEIIDCLVYYLANYLAKSGIVKIGLEAIRMGQIFFKAALDDILLQVESLKYLEPFKANTYRLEGSEFCIKGFELLHSGIYASVEFNKVSYDEIVGNKAAKQKSIRRMLRLCCFDPHTRKNPMMDLGVLPKFTAKIGNPGTGKGMDISAEASYLEEKVSELVGIPFFLHPMPQSLVSTFQGGSGKDAHQYLIVMRDPTKIILGCADDAENNFPDRTRKDVNSGQAEIVQELLPFIEGPLALWHGNSIFQAYTNLIEKIDPAVRSRFQEIIELMGAESWEDFIDLNWILQKKLRKVSDKIVTMKKPDNYEYLDAQKIVSSLNELEHPEEPTHPFLKQAFYESRKLYNFDEDAFYGTFFTKVKQKYPNFSPRDVKNIHSTVYERIYDFDFPEDWINNPGKFFRVNPEKNYETKLRMIEGLVIDNMGNFKYPDIIKQESIRYLETMLMIQERGRENAIKEAKAEMEIRNEAAIRLKKEELEKANKQTQLTEGR